MAIDPKSLPNDVEELKTLLVDMEHRYEQHLGEQQKMIDLLLEQIRLHKHRKFKSKSEQLAQLALHGLFDEIEQLADGETDEPETKSDATVDSQNSRKKGRRKLPKDLPRETIVHDLDEADKVCACGNPLHCIGEDRSEKLEIIPMQFKVIEHVRPKYACRACEDGVKVHSLPPQPIPRGIATAGLLAFIIVSKFVDHLPLYRIEKLLKRFGVELSRTTQANWLIRVAGLLAPLYIALQLAMRQRDYIHIDETPLQVLNEPNRQAQQKSYMWVYLTGCGPPIALFDYQQTRGTRHPEAILGDAFRGTIQVDGLSSYRSLTAKSDGRIRQIACMAHVRRKFVDAQRIAPKKSTSTLSQGTARPETAIRLIAQLYRIEKQCRDLDPKERRAIRQAEAKPIFDRLLAWCQSMQPKVSTKSVFGGAIRYALAELPLIEAYLEDGRFAIDNNPVEREIKPFVIGRKGWLFFDSVQGANASSVLYSIVQTAKLNGIEPYSYLRDVIDRLAADPTDVDSLLPWNWAPTEKFEKPRLAA